MVRDDVSMYVNVVYPLFQIFPILGLPAEFRPSNKISPNSMDAVFVSARAASYIQSEAIQNLLRPGALIAAESSKFLVPLNKAQKEEFNSKLEEYGISQGWTKIPGKLILFVVYLYIFHFLSD